MKRFLLLLIASLFLFSSCQLQKARAAAYLGSEAFAEGLYSQAAYQYGKAASAQHDSAEYRYNQILSLLLDASLDEVIVQSDKAFSDFPFHTEFLLLKARAYATQKAYKKALAVYQQVFALDPGSYTLQQAVMEQAVAWNENETAKNLALTLLSHPQTEQKALQVLTELEGKQSWYAYALNYLTKEAGTQAPAELQPQSK
ncbi:MAG: hypothetical protein AB7C91_01085 [Sphaerochaeta sp.]|uniref:hypothetical protein n=1 Tax=Sphaerochaeta sp. TaxID=1972642 RepID=UPI002FC6D9E9